MKLAYKEHNNDAASEARCLTISVEWGKHLEPSVTVVEAGIDWLTCRTREEPGASALRQWGEDELQAEVRLGRPAKAWAWYGFAGRSAGAVRWGVGDRGVVVILSGARAHSSFRAAVAWSEKITRIDLCCTVRCEPPRKDVSVKAHSEAIIRYKSAANTPKPSMWIGSEGGITAYLGDRTSSYFGRVYDKEVQSGDVAYVGCWRYEVECKSGVAAEVARMAYETPDLVAFCAGYVWGWWDERGVEPVFMVKTAYQEATATRHSQDDENTLGWLRQAVRPSVERLIGRGRILETYDALGLTI